MTSKPRIRKTIAAALAAAFVSVGVMAWSGPAEARFGGGMGGGGFHGGMGGGFHGGGFDGGGMRMGGFAGRPFAHSGFATHRAVFADHRFHYHGFVGPFFALTAFGAPYYYSDYFDNGGCYVVRRRHIDQWGHVVVRRELECY
jgi:uncharacterized membrane protein